jgi:hypothetical protein
MSNDAIFRTACVAAAVALAAAPYWPQIRSAAVRAAEAVSARAGTLTQWGAVLLLLAAAMLGKLPTLPASVPQANVTVETPSVEMQAKVAGVARALASLNPAERAVWASVWEKAGVVVSAPEGKEAVFSDTRSLRGFTVLSLDIAWRRLAGKQPGEFPGLREAVEKVLGETVGMDVQPVTAEIRKTFAEACRAIAWAGIGRG